MEDSDLKQIGMRIKAIRTQNNITQNQLADIIGSDRTVIARIENGNQGFSIDYLIKIANALETSADSILAGSLEYIAQDPTERQIYSLLLNCSITRKELLSRILIALKDILEEYNIQ